MYHIRVGTPSRKWGRVRRRNAIPSREPEGDWLETHDMVRSSFASLLTWEQHPTLSLCAWEAVGRLKTCSQASKFLSIEWIDTNSYLNYYDPNMNIHVYHTCRQCINHDTCAEKKSTIWRSAWPENLLKSKLKWFPNSAISLDTALIYIHMYTSEKLPASVVGILMASPKTKEKHAGCLRMLYAGHGNWTLPAPLHQMPGAEHPTTVG